VALSILVRPELASAEPEQRSRSARLRVNRGALALAAAVVLAAAGCGSQTTGNTPGASQYKPITIVNRTGLPPNWGYYGTEMSPPLPKPEWTLTDTAGAAYDVGARTQGRITILLFGYTQCPDICPTEVADLVAALRALPAAVSGKVTVLLITVDPAHDTGPVLSAYIRRFNPSPASAFVGLTASDPMVIKDAGELGIQVGVPRKIDGVDTVAHGAQEEVFGRNGYAIFFWDAATPVLDIAHDINQLASL
jgi:protein SCO1/2